MNVLVDYAFSFLKLHQLYVHIPVDNEASKALLPAADLPLQVS